MNNGIIVLTFHEQDLTKDCGRGLHGPGPDFKPVPRPDWQMRGDFSNRPGWQMKIDFFLQSRLGRQKRNEFGLGPGLRNPAHADLSRALKTARQKELVRFDN